MGQDPCDFQRRLRMHRDPVTSEGHFVWARTSVTSQGEAPLVALVDSPKLSWRSQLQIFSHAASRNHLPTS